MDFHNVIMRKNSEIRNKKKNQLIFVLRSKSTSEIVATLPLSNNSWKEAVKMLRYKRKFITKKQLMQKKNIFT